MRIYDSAARPGMKTNKSFSFVQATQKKTVTADAYVAGLQFNLACIFSLLLYSGINSKLYQNNCDCSM